MAANMANILKKNFFNFQPLTLFRRHFTGTIVVFNQQPGQSQSSNTINENVPGLSSAVHTNEEPVGPGASRTGEYKVPEYFNYNKISYFEAEIEMQRYRCEQPSAVKE